MGRQEDAECRVGTGEPGGLGPWGEGTGLQTQPLWGGRGLTPGQGGEEGEVCAVGPLTGRECRDTTRAYSPRARHKLQNNLFPVTHPWGLANSTP